MALLLYCDDEYVHHSLESRGLNFFCNLFPLFDNLVGKCDEVTFAVL